MPRDKFYGDNKGLHYRLAWSFVYWLHKVVDSKRSPYKDIIRKYFKTAVDTRDIKKANEAAFAGIDIDRMEAEWKAFWLDMTRRREANGRKLDLKRSLLGE